MVFDDGVKSWFYLEGEKTKDEIIQELSDKIATWFAYVEPNERGRVEVEIEKRQDTVIVKVYTSWWESWEARRYDAEATYIIR